MSEEKTKRKICEDCGNEIPPPFRENRKYCAACGKNRHDESMRLYKERERKMNVAPRMRKVPAEKPMRKKQHRCTGCFYWRVLGGDLWGCHYLLVTGNMRSPLKAEDCYKHDGTPYTEKTRKRCSP